MDRNAIRVIEINQTDHFRGSNGSLNCSNLLIWAVRIDLSITWMFKGQQYMKLLWGMLLFSCPEFSLVSTPSLQSFPVYHSLWLFNLSSIAWNRNTWTLHTQTEWHPWSYTCNTSHLEGPTTLSGWWKDNLNSSNSFRLEGGSTSISMPSSTTKEKMLGLMEKMTIRRQSKKRSSAIDLSKDEKRDNDWMRDQSCSRFWNEVRSLAQNWWRLEAFRTISRDIWATRDDNKRWKAWKIPHLWSADVGTYHQLNSSLQYCLQSYQNPFLNYFLRWGMFWFLVKQILLSDIRY